MNIKHIANIAVGQDGAFYNDYLFRFETSGLCHVYDAGALKKDCREAADLREISTFCLDRADELVPHSNSVTFGKEYYRPGDEFPLLYTNIYNNYAKADDPLKGVCCVYRLQRSGTEFSSTLVQLIEIGFTENDGYWSSGKEEGDVRPYGNFAVDAENGILYAFTMRDKCRTTRYFSFDLPCADDGIADERFNVKKVTLNICDIKEQFDCAYHHYIQGACAYGGKVYSLEGFTESKENPPALRVIDAAAKRQVLHLDFTSMGLTVEPELIDFKDGICYYGDAHGNLYVIDF